MKALFGRSSLLVSSAVVCCLAATSAHAEGQDQPAPQTPAETEAQVAPAEPVARADSPGQSQEIVVTGSRLATGFAMPTPVTTLSTAELMKTAPNSLAESLVQVPSLNGSTVSTNSGTGSANSQTNGQSLLNLRGLGPHRTLVLLDGQRMGVTNVVNSVDVNIIPQNLVRRVDVVTGGASASYGSDAVAGVVNFILDSHFTGVKAEVSGGVTSRNDAENFHASLAVGHSFGDKTRIVASSDFYRLNGIPYSTHTGRDWFDNPMGAWPNTTGVGPSTITAEPARGTATYGGVIHAISGCATGTAAAAVACRNLFVGTAGTTVPQFQFLEGGVLAPFNQGTLAGRQFTAGGDGAVVNNGLTPDIKRESIFVHAETDVTDDITLWAEGSYARNWSYNAAQPPIQTTTSRFTIFEDNAYLPAALQTIFAGNTGTQSLGLSRYDLDMDLVQVLGVSKVKRFGAGVKGKISSRWSFDATAGYQDTHQDLDVYNTILNRNLYAAADAVRRPDNGQIVCRSAFYASTTSTVFLPGGSGRDADCVPMNLFGPNAVTQAASDYVMGWNTGDIDLKQQTFDFNIRGDLGDKFQFGAGPISTAFGVSYRRLTATRKVDALSALNIDGSNIRGFPTSLWAAAAAGQTQQPGRYGSYQFYNPSPLSGKVRVSEAYAEVGVPILKDVPGFQALSATLAGRVTDYSQSGIEPMWKVGVNWTVMPDIRFRATYSADTRAPSVLELFNTAQATNAASVFPYSNAPTRFNVSGLNITTGNPNLDPERARTFTAGVILQPRFLPRFQASVDYYKIKIRDSILALGAQEVVDNCFFGDTSACADIVVVTNTGVNRGLIPSTNVILVTDSVTVTSRNINYAVESTSGLDFEAMYNMDVGSGRLNARFTGNYIISAKVQNSCLTADVVGDLGTCGSYPRFRGRLGVNYEIGRFGFYVQERYIHGGKKNKLWVEGVDITENDVPATWYTDLNLTYRFGKTVLGDTEFFFNVTNLLDQDPRDTLSRSRSWIESSDLSVYDALGRRYVAGLRIKI